MNKRINIGEQKDAFEKQLSVFDSFVKTVVEESEKFGFSDETTKLVLEELHKAKKGYEKGIQEIERIRQEELERQHQEEQARLDRITSMEIPMDWENFFLSDQRAAGIQAESAGDGLILSLTNLGRVDIEYIFMLQINAGFPGFVLYVTVVIGKTGRIQSIPLIQGKTVAENVGLHHME